MIYADNNGSMPLLPSVKEYLIKRLEGPFANPNAIHSLGQKINRGMEKCRRTCAKILGANPEQLIFNSGASEGIAHVFCSTLGTKPTDRNIIITSGIEHSAVVNNCKKYAKLGYEIVTIKTLGNGLIDLSDLKDKMNTNVALICVMAANNETGVVQPISKISQISKEFGAKFFSDTTQFIGKCDFNFNESGLDYAVLSSHKIGALIGSGAILVKEPTSLCTDFLPGGGQENNYRGGTQNYIGVECLTIALDTFANEIDRLEDIKIDREEFEDSIKAKFPKVIILGDDSPRLAGTTLISYPGIHGQAVQIELESKDIFVTTSSACSDNQPETSKVLKAMGIEDNVGRGVVRISFCTGAPKEYYTQTTKALIDIYEKLAQISSY